MNIQTSHSYTINNNFVDSIHFTTLPSDLLKEIMLLTLFYNKNNQLEYKNLNALSRVSKQFNTHIFTLFYQIFKKSFLTTESILERASARGALPIVQLCLSPPPHLSSDEFYKSQFLLHKNRSFVLAARKGQISIAKELIKNNEISFKTYKDAFLNAVNYNQKDMITFLLANSNMPPDLINLGLTLAIEKDLTEIVKKILEDKTALISLMLRGFLHAARNLAQMLQHSQIETLLCNCLQTLEPKPEKDDAKCAIM